MDNQLQSEVIKIKYYYTDKTYKELLNNMVVLVDSREKSNEHIIEYFEKNKIPYKTKALKTGDYSFMIKACAELGFPIDTYFTDELCIERKNSVDELAGNLTEESGRIMKEFNRMRNIETVYLIIENNVIDDIMGGNYKSKYNADSFFRTLLTLQKRCNFYLNFVKSQNTGKMIYEICKNLLDSKILK